MLSGIQSHMDIFTTLAAAAGEPDVVNKMRVERKQYLDGVNNLGYWTGKTDESARDNFIYYHESNIRAVRYKQWKLNFETSENYYDPYVKQKFPVIFNLRMDPFESFDGLTDRSDIVQAKQWLNEPVQEVLGEHGRPAVLTLARAVKVPPQHLRREKGAPAAVGRGAGARAHSGRRSARGAGRSAPRSAQSAR
jgi:arylsulfatase A-like enzyme